MHKPVALSLIVSNPPFPVRHYQTMCTSGSVFHSSPTTHRVQTMLIAYSFTNRGEDNIAGSNLATASV